MVTAAATTMTPNTTSQVLDGVSFLRSFALIVAAASTVAIARMTAPTMVVIVELNPDAAVAWALVNFFFMRNRIVSAKLPRLSGV